MTYRATCFVSLLLVTACGGASFRDGDGGEGGSAGSSTGKGGSSSKGGSSGRAGSTSTGGSIGVAGTTSSGGAACGPIACNDVPCSQGMLLIRPGECCPSCSCDAIDCAYPVCEDGQAPVVEPGACCPTCPPDRSSCKGTLCTDISAPACGAGHQYERPAGACCTGCSPIPGQVGCVDIACPPDVGCAPGYVRGDLAGGCCYECVPDPLYCESDTHCLIADRPRPCCGCAEAISTRLYDEDACWSSITNPRQILMECYPQETCDLPCAACPVPGVAKCIDRRCTQVY